MAFIMTCAFLVAEDIFIVEVGESARVGEVPEQCGMEDFREHQHAGDIYCRVELRQYIDSIQVAL